MKTLASLTALPALAVAIYSIVDARSTAERSGALDQSQVLLLLGDQILVGSEVTAYFRVSSNTAKRATVVGELPLGLGNAGLASAERVILAINFFDVDGLSPGVKREDLEELLTRTGPYPASVSRSVSEADESYWVQYSISPLLQGMHFGVGEPVQVPLPISIEDLPVTTADGVTATVDTTFTYSLKVPVSMMSEDFGSFATTLSIGSIVADEDDELLEKVDDLLTERINGIRKEEAFFQFLKRFFNGGLAYAYVIDADPIYTVDDSFEFLRAAGVEYYSAKIFSWRRLFSP